MTNEDLTFMDLDDLIAMGKRLGITQAANMKEENLIKRIAMIEGGPEQPKEQPINQIGVDLNDEDKQALKAIGFGADWLELLANQYQFTRFEYMAKFKAFRCYREGRHVDWIDVNDLSLLNGGRPLCTILLKHQPLSPTRQVIKYNWR